MKKALTRKLLENKLHISVSKDMYDFKTPYGTYRLYHVFKRDHKGEMKELTPYIVHNPKSTYIQYQIQNISSYTKKNGVHNNYVQYPEYTYRMTAQRLFFVWYKGLDFPELTIVCDDYNDYNYSAANLILMSRNDAMKRREKKAIVDDLSKKYGVTFTSIHDFFEWDAKRIK